MSPDAVRAVVRVRTVGPSGLNPPQTEAIDRLQALTEDGPITELDVDVWGTSMGITQTDWDPVATRERVDEFEQWATEQGYTLEPAFHWRGAESDGDEESQRRHVVTPLIALAVYTATDSEEEEEAETLQAVYPHVAGEEVRTIQDGIEALESIARGAEQSARDMSEQPVVPAE